MRLRMSGLLMLAGILGSGSAVASPLPVIAGKWQCTPQHERPDEQSWVTYDFKPDGTVKSQEWVRYEKQEQTQLEYQLFVDYRYVAKESDYMLTPVKLSREIIQDPNHADPFDYAARRDLTGYRIFFKPTLKDDQAIFDMWYHITPEKHFFMQCRHDSVA
ncbi:hypothetical protein [Photobacterium sp. TY1-4]|uniref:hypothetical protein n=1 Tax=Photobacterium sp. TY1-4 TaxID=2899122 RepID=UPI0021C06E1A|nr:hypothetical protein [Photobacterium sp. TY1-4]UXI04457.1 hypothetical protein NH461_20435 [Photobacterium sp. TY1-4]